MEKICDTYILDNTQLLRQRNMITQSPPRPRVLLFYLNLVLFMAKILKFVYNPKKFFLPREIHAGSILKQSLESLR